MDEINKKNDHKLDLELQKLASPARRALINSELFSLKDISKISEKELSELHGMGPNALGKIREAMNKNNLSFSN